ncbi:hypothetical protein LZ32DRAFT_605642 [Colletotrichum eremochloae]|nr:hypothetical protein LZ32DRAFT_605642 [Colletotrichum eremochloae]
MEGLTVTLQISLFFFFPLVFFHARILPLDQVAIRIVSPNTTSLAFYVLSDESRSYPI